MQAHNICKMCVVMPSLDKLALEIAEVSLDIHYIFQHQLPSVGLAQARPNKVSVPRPLSHTPNS